MKKIIVLCVIVLFVGMGFQPAFANIIENNPPYEPSNPFPPDGATNVSGCSVSWTGGDPDDDNVTYDIYHDDYSPPKQVGWNQSTTFYPCGDCKWNTTYYWKIIAWDEHGASTTGPIWSFTTEENLPPNPAEDPIPFDGDCCVPVEGVILKWNGSDPNVGDTLRYDLYFDDVNPPFSQQLKESYKNCWEIPFTLSKYKDYYWKVDTYDNGDLFTEGPIWSFSTDYIPPSNPIIEGPYHGVKNQEYEFTFVSVNPENDSIQYHVKWDDGTENLTELYPSGVVVTLSHSWSHDGEKVIQAKAIDEHGANSDWSIFEFTVPRSKVLNFNLFELLFSQLLFVQKLILFIK